MKNVLEHFVTHYSYEDKIFEPGDPGKLYKGGISFTHDMGVGNHLVRIPILVMSVEGLTVNVSLT